VGRRRFPLLVVAGAAAGATALAVLRQRARRPRRMHPALQGRPLLIAHRGGSLLAPENTIVAFRTATEIWNADMIELDVRASLDGRCVVIHDATVDRTTDGTGEVSAMEYAHLAELDAGYRFSHDGGATYPFRGQGVRIPLIEEVFEALPEARFTIEVKHRSAQEPLFAAIQQFGAAHRVVAAGMYDADRTMFRGYAGPISASTEQLRRFYILHRLRSASLVRLQADVVQVPEEHEGRRVVTPSFIRTVHAQGLPLHVWTVNRESDMDRLLDWGVDGLLTDRPDLLGRVLHRRVARPLAPGHDPAPEPAAD
jgi:glycerophosphoryl diester phosphodiesterase